MLDELIALDKALMLKINTHWTNSFLDTIMPIWRDAKTWVPLYIAIIVWLFYKFGTKAWIWLVTVGIMMAVSDQLSSKIIKPFFGRARPCNDPEIGSQVRRLLGRCTDSFSFTSSHAFNHFCIATFIILTFKPYLGNKVYFFWLWAFSIAYGQVYVGVHFPLDIIVGGILGALLGFTFAKIFLNKIGMPSLVIRSKK